MKLAAILLCAPLLMAQADLPPDPTCDMEIRAPGPDVIDFMQRTADCNHWTGEEPYDADRRAEIEANIADLGCLDLDKDEAELRASYEGPHAATVDELIAESKELLGWTGCPVNEG